MTVYDIDTDVDLDRLHYSTQIVQNLLDTVAHTFLLCGTAVPQPKTADITDTQKWHNLSTGCNVLQLLGARSIEYSTKFWFQQSLNKLFMNS